jgi:hypothetical protein
MFEISRKGSVKSETPDKRLMGATHLPVEFEDIIQLVDVKGAALPDEIDTARPSRTVERYEHDIWQIRATQFNIQDTSSGLYLCLKSMRLKASKRSESGIFTRTKIQPCLSDHQTS